MLLKAKHTIILLIGILLITSCRPTKYVPDGEYLLNKNKIDVTGDKLEKDEVESILRQPENYKRVGVKWKLMAYNAVDSASVANKRTAKNIKRAQKNQSKRDKEDRINKKRLEKAKEKGHKYYREKTVSLKDTIDPPMFLKEWFKYKIGEPPVVFDSIPFNKTKSQLKAYLESKGYYYSKVNGIVEYNEKSKVNVRYLIATGEQYIIDSLKYQIDNDAVTKSYLNYLNIQDHMPLEGEPFDADELDDFRYDIAKYMKNESYYGFLPSSITFVADTNKAEMKVNLKVIIGDRAVPSKIDADSLIYLPYVKTKIKNVYFHVADTTLYGGNFKQTIEDKNLELYKNQFITTLDTIYFNENFNKSGVVDTSRMAIITYNGGLFVKSKVLESLNYLEKSNYYSEKKVEQSYRALLQSGVFKMIKTDLIDIGGGEVEVHYYLVPNKKQSIGFEPRATNANGYLGVSANIHYSNRNLFKGAEKLTFTISGGFESQPPVFGVDDNGNPIITSPRSFNIFEIGPSLKLELPKFFPFDIKEISKKNRPYTVISTAYSYQQRADFQRGSFQLNYLWRFAKSRTHLFHAGFPFLSVIKVININKSQEFEDKLNQLGDLFLINAYSNQFVWQDWKFSYDYSNKDKENKRGNSSVYVVSTFDPAGNLLSLYNKVQGTNPNVQDSIFGLPYSQFARLDNEFIFSKPLGKAKSIHVRLMAGAGVPYGNTTTSLPYDYSFYAGGANDNRGWRARSLGPGSYNYLFDPDRTSTQLGDIRLGGSLEYRFGISSLLKGAFFLDAGNVWTINEDENRIGAKFSSNWYKEIGLATGIGVRVDLDYFIFRIDLGVPLTNTALPPGEKWIFTKDRPKFEAAAFTELGADWQDVVPDLFTPQFHFGIGYPF